MTYLEKYIGFKKELAVAETFEEIKLIENKAAAAADFAKRSGIGKKEQDEWGDFRVDIESKKGAWLEANFPHGVKKQFKSSNQENSSMKDMGIYAQESSDARLIKKEDELKKEVVEEIKKDDEIIVTPREVSKRIRKRKKEENLKVEKDSIESNKYNIDIRYGDFKNVLSDVNNIDLILTDPPYPKEYLNCFSELSLFAKNHLSNDGFCAVYSGQYHLPEVIKKLSEHLIYVWTFCLYHVGQKQIVNGVNIMCGWKPVLIFSKGNKKMRYSAYDVIESKNREKDKHEWQQSLSGSSKLIEIFSEPNDLVVDPFAGSCTFLKAAIKLGRKATGAEINDKTKI